VYYPKPWTPKIIHSIPQGTDPFSRTELTMGVVKPNLELQPWTLNPNANPTFVHPSHPQGTDPFSRTELTMDMVKPNVELRARIRAYLAEQGMGTPKGGGTPKKTGISKLSV
jgi:hypothetical protein